MCKKRKKKKQLWVITLERIQRQATHGMGNLFLHYYFVASLLHLLEILVLRFPLNFHNWNVCFSRELLSDLLLLCYLIRHLKVTSSFCQRQFLAGYVSSNYLTWMQLWSYLRYKRPLRSRQGWILFFCYVSLDRIILWW